MLFQEKTIRLRYISDGRYIIKEILSNKSKDEIVDNIHSHLITLGEEVTQGKKPLSNYIIYKVGTLIYSYREPFKISIFSS